MTTYYASPYGVDSNNGLGPDPNHPTDRPWKTVGEGLNTGTAISNATANTLWLAPGIYFGEALSPIVTVASSANPLAVKGDPTNSQGFKDGTGARLPVGIVWITNRTAVEGMDANPAISGSVLLSGKDNAANGLQFSDLVLENWSSIVGVDLTPAGNTDWSFTRVRFVGNGALHMPVGIAWTAGRNWTFRGCIFESIYGLACTTSTAAATADADLNILFESCLYLGTAPIGPGALSLGSAAGNKAGGIRWKGCTIIAGGVTAFLTTASQVSTSTPLRMEGCRVFAATAVNAGTAGQVVDDGNCRFCTPVAASTNFAPAGTSVSNAAMAEVLPDLVLWGLASNINDVFGWGPGSVSTQYASGWNAKGITDYRNRTARPWGGGSSIGYIEATPAMMDTTSQLTGGGAKCLAVYAQGEVSVPVQLDPVATTITVLTKSTAYVGTTWPSAVLQANPSIGVTATTAAATSATEQTLTIGPFTPTDAGVGELRLISQNSGNSGWTYFDILQAA